MDRHTKKTSLQTGTRSKARNPAIECCRLIASVFVVFIHIGFPDAFGEIINCLARFAVPFFFVVSGYFAYQADEAVIKKRTIGILKLNIYATSLYLLWGCFQEKYIFHRSIMSLLKYAFSSVQLSQWFLFCQNPFAGHLWYLSAIFVSYIVIYAYVRWGGKTYRYQTLYIVSILLYAVYFMMSSVATATELEIPRIFYRNAVFFGIPMFSLGIFIREYQDRILETYRLTRKKLILIIAFGAALSMIQWRGMGATEMPAGTLFEIIALMLLLSCVSSDVHSSQVGSFITSKLGELSAYIYVTHILWGSIYGEYIREHLSLLGERTVAYLTPLLVVFLSVCTGTIWMLAKGMVRKCLLRLSSFVSE